MFAEWANVWLSLEPCQSHESERLLGKNLERTTCGLRAHHKTAVDTHLLISWTSSVAPIGSLCSGNVFCFQSLSPSPAHRSLNSAFMFWQPTGGDRMKLN